MANHEDHSSNKSNEFTVDGFMLKEGQVIRARPLWRQSTRLAMIFFSAAGRQRLHQRPQQDSTSSRDLRPAGLNVVPHYVMLAPGAEANSRPVFLSDAVTKTIATAAQIPSIRSLLTFISPASISKIDCHCLKVRGFLPFPESDIKLDLPTRCQHRTDTPGRQSISRNFR